MRVSEHWRREFIAIMFGDTPLSLHIAYFSTFIYFGTIWIMQAFNVSSHPAFIYRYLYILWQKSEIQRPQNSGTTGVLLNQHYFLRATRTRKSQKVGPSIYSLWENGVLKNQDTRAKWLIANGCECVNCNCLQEVIASFWTHRFGNEQVVWLLCI